MQKKSLTGRVASIVLGLFAGAVLAPFLSDSADVLNAHEEERRLGEAVFFLKIKAENYRDRHGPIPASLKDLIDSDKSRPPYFEIKRIKLREIVELINFGEENEDVTWEGFEDVKDQVQLVPDKHQQGVINVRIWISSREREKCLRLASMFLASGARYSARADGRWYDSFRISPLIEGGQVNGNTFETRKLMLISSKGRGDHLAKTVTTVDQVCAFPGNGFSYAGWHLEWVGL